jgi:lysophospholipase L1-like esterase
MLYFLKPGILAALTYATIGLTSLIQPAMNQTPVSNHSAHKYTFLSLGDSYTIGESVEEQDRWSVQLAAMLREKGVDVAPPDIIARTGWTTAELAEAIQKSGNANTYDLVSLLIGVNNQYRGQPLDRYRAELRELLQTAIRFAKGRPDRVVVLSIPDWGVTPFARDRDGANIAAEIDAFNAACREEAEKASVRFFDITPFTRQVQNDPSQLASDGLHYSGKQHRRWAETVLPEVMKLLRN